MNIPSCRKHCEADLLGCATGRTRCNPVSFGATLRDLRRQPEALDALDQARLLVRKDNGTLILLPRIRLLEALTLNTWAKLNRR